MRQAFKTTAKKILLLILNPRFLLCFGIAWLMTNGWSYILFAVGTYFQIGWMMAVSGAYVTFLWFPFTPEKVLTLTIAILLLRRLFPNDEKTLGVLRDMFARAKQKHRMRKRNKDTPTVAQIQQQK